MAYRVCAPPNVGSVRQQGKLNRFGCVRGRRCNKFGCFRPSLGRLRPTSADLDQTWAEFGRSWAMLDGDARLAALGRPDHCSSKSNVGDPISKRCLRTRVVKRVVVFADLRFPISARKHELGGPRCVLVTRRAAELAGRLGWRRAVGAGRRLAGGWAQPGSSRRAMAQARRPQAAGCVGSTPSVGIGVTGGLGDQTLEAQAA